MRAATLSLMGFCGMRIPYVEAHERLETDEVRQKAARIIRSLRRDGFPVSTREKGKEWEIGEPEDCCMVPDECGVLCLREVPPVLLCCYSCGEDVEEGEDCSCRLCAFCDVLDCDGRCQEEEETDEETEEE